MDAQRGAPEPMETRWAASAVDRLAAWIARHWLALFNVFLALFIGLPLAAPVLMAAGAALPARLIYAAYSLTCHQLPERSFFLFGPDSVYDVARLEQLGVVPAGLSILQRQFQRSVGNLEAGFKVALCERDLAIYGAMLLSGLAFGLLRRRLGRGGRRLPRLRWWAFLLFLLPALIDGGTQLIGLRESSYLLRLLTGGLFGAAAVWLAYPYVEEAMAEILRSARRKTGQKAPSAV